MSFSRSSTGCSPKSQCLPQSGRQRDRIRQHLSRMPLRLGRRRLRCVRGGRHQHAQFRAQQHGRALRHSADFPAYWRLRSKGIIVAARAYAMPAPVLMTSI